MIEEQVSEFVAKSQIRAKEFIESGDEQTKRVISKKNREEIYQSKGDKCPTCDNILTESTDHKSSKSYAPTSSSITVEHILPLYLGGNNKLGNLVAMCYACNNQARNETQRHFIQDPVQSNRGKPLTKESEDIINRFTEWSIRGIKTPSTKIDNEIQEYFETVRTQFAPRLSLEERIAVLETKIHTLENTLWKRTMRTIGSFFQRAKDPVGAVEKPSIEKQAPQPQKKDPAKKKAPAKEKTPDFTAEEFVGGLLRHKTKVGEELYNMIYADMIREEPRFNLKKYDIKPSSYLEENCSELLLIEKRLHKNGETSSLWITALVPIKFRQEVLAAFNESEEGVLEFTVICDIQRDIKKEFNLSWNQFFNQFCMNDRGAMNTKIKALLKANNIPHALSRDSEAEMDYAHYKTQEDCTEEFRSIIKGIIAESDRKKADGRHKLTISALGQRFSKRVQALGFDNKKEYFQQNGLDPTMSITKAISAYFSEGKIEFVGEKIWTGSEFKTNPTDVVLNRRG